MAGWFNGGFASVAASSAAADSFEGSGKNLVNVGDGAFAYAQPLNDVDISDANSTTLDLGTDAFYYSGLKVKVDEEATTVVKHP